MRLFIMLLCVLQSVLLSRAFKNDTEFTKCSDQNFEVSPKKWSPPLVKIGSKYYYLNIFYKLSWYKAAQFCRYHGMDLASISSQQESDELRLYITNTGVTDTLFWTSGTDLGSEGSFYWMSNGRPLTFSNFPPGQPDNWKLESTGETENCLLFRNERGAPHTYLDDLCSNLRLFICELQ